MSAVTSCPGEVELRRLVEGSLSSEEQAPITEHVEICPACQAALERVSGGGGWAERISQKLSQRGDSADHTLQEAINRLIDRLRNDRVSAATIVEGFSIADTKLDFLQPSDKPGVLGTLGPYEITEVIGRGGMGVVLKGFDPRLNRFAAVKVLAPETASNPTARRRFLREAQAAAAISHDHVVTIHAVDESERLPYLVMEYVSGMSLHELLNRKGALDVKEILRIGMQAAAGLAAAHAQGLVHRDIKPANILLENGVQRVKITDFGLARAVDDVGITQTGVVSGTPLYMSPEQARGEPMDHRTDLFSLGSVLYAMCTGRAPFRAETTMGVLRRVCEDTPRPIQGINPEIPHTLCDIIEQLLEKDPEDRFQSAAEVTQRLGECLAYAQQPGAMPNPVSFGVSPRRAKLRKAVAGLAGDTIFGLAVVCVLVAAVALIFVRLYVGGERRGIGFGFTEVTAPTRTIRGHQQPLNAVAVSPDGRLALTGSSDRTLRLWDLQTGRELRRMTGHTDFINAVALSPDGRRALSGSKDGTVRLWDIETGDEIRCLRGHRGWIYTVAISPDGRRAVSGSAHWGVASPDNTMRLWDLETGDQLRSFEGHTDGVLGVAFSPDGRLAASASFDCSVRLWNVETGELVHLLEHPSRAYSVAFTPDGRHVVSGCGSLKPHSDRVDDPEHCLIRLWDVKTGELANVLKGHSGAVLALSLAADGRYLVSGSGGEYFDDGRLTQSRDNTVRLWDLAGDREVCRFHSQSMVLDVALSPDSRFILSGHMDHALRLWNVPQQPLAAVQGSDPRPALKEIRRFDGSHLEPILCLALSPDGTYLLSGSYDDTARLWEIATGREVRAFLGHTTAINDLAISPDGRLALSGSDHGEAFLWDVETGARIRQVEGHSAYVRAVAFSPDGRLAATGSASYVHQHGDELDNTVRLWDVESGAELRRLNGITHPINDLQFSPDGGSLLIGAGSRAVGLWEVESGQVVREFNRPPSSPLSVAFSPDGRRAVSGHMVAGPEFTKDGKFFDPGHCVVCVWDVATGGLLRMLKGHTGPVNSVAFSPDGRYVLSASGGHHYGQNPPYLQAHDNTLRLWDVETGAQVWQADAGGCINSAAFTPNGRFVISGGGELNKFGGDGKPDLRLWRIPGTFNIQ